MKEIVDEVERWRQHGEQVAVATVVATRCPPAAGRLEVRRLGDAASICGSVSGGCVESDVVEQAKDVLETGVPKLLTYGISDDEALGVGLPCGGEIDVFVERFE